MINRKLIVKISYGLIAALVLVLVCLLIYQKSLIRANEIGKNAVISKLVEMYNVYKNYHLLHEIADESEKVTEIYHNDTPENAIEALLIFKDKLEYTLNDFDDNSEGGFINRSTIIGDLSLAYGRLSIKYLEINDSDGYEENIHKALFYINQRFKKMPSEDEFIQFIKRIDENYLKKNKDQNG